MGKLRLPQNHNKLDFQNSWELVFKVRTMKCFNCNEIAWQNCILIYKFQLFLMFWYFHAFLEFAVPVCTCKIEKYDEIWHEIDVN